MTRSHCSCVFVGRTMEPIHSIDDSSSYRTTSPVRSPYARYTTCCQLLLIFNKQVGRVAETRQYFAFCEMFVVPQLHASLSERVFKRTCTC